jgi:hypothetical protein
MKSPVFETDRQIVAITYQNCFCDLSILNIGKYYCAAQKWFSLTKVGRFADFYRNAQK